MIDAGMGRAYRELEARVRPFVARRVPSPEVDDVVQDVFLRMQRGLPALRDEQRLGAWVYQVARSAIAEQRRARARHPLVAGDRPEPEEPLAPEEDDRAVEQELAAYVAPLVAMLPSPYREALTLTELEEMTQRDAADLLGVSVSGMKSRVQRGRERLRELLDSCCEIALDARGRVIACQPRGPGSCCDGPLGMASTRQRADPGQTLAHSRDAARACGTDCRSVPANPSSEK